LRTIGLRFSLYQKLSKMRKNNLAPLFCQFLSWNRVQERSNIYISLTFKYNYIPTSVNVVSFDTRSLWRYFDFQSFWYFVHRNVATKIFYMMVNFNKILCDISNIDRRFYKPMPSLERSDYIFQLWINVQCYIPFERSFQEKCNALYFILISLTVKKLTFEIFENYEFSGNFSEFLKLMTHTY
jgi:hypothetical protein